MTGAYPLDIDSDGITDLVLLRVGENVVMRGLGGCQLRARQRSLGLRRRRRLVDGASPRPGSTAPTGRRSRSATTSTATRTSRPGARAPTTGCTGPISSTARASAGSPRRCALKPSFCALSMLFTDWNRSGTPQPARLQRPRILRGRPGAALACRARQGAGALHRQARAGKSCASGAWASPATTSTATAIPEYFLTSMADNKLQTLASGARRTARPATVLCDVAFAKGVTAHRPYTGGDWQPEHGLARAVRGRQQ